MLALRESSDAVMDLGKERPFLLIVVSRERARTMGDIA